MNDSIDKTTKAKDHLAVTKVLAVNQLCTIVGVDKDSDKAQQIENFIETFLMASLLNVSIVQNEAYQDVRKSSTHT